MNSLSQWIYYCGTQYYRKGARRSITRDVLQTCNLCYTRLHVYATSPRPTCPSRGGRGAQLDTSSHTFTLELKTTSFSQLIKTRLTPLSRFRQPGTRYLSVCFLFITRVTASIWGGSTPSQLVRGRCSGYGACGRPCMSGSKEWYRPLQWSYALFSALVSCAHGVDRNTDFFFTTLPLVRRQIFEQAGHHRHGPTK